MIVVNIHEAKTKLSSLLKLVEEGKQVIIARNNEKIAEIKPYRSKKTRGGFGKGKSKIVYHADWDEMDKEIEQLFNEK